jgi:exosortase A-associated hydrolase 2
MAVVQEPVSLLVAGTAVRGMTYRPAEGGGPMGMVLCDPFAEEKKSSQKTLAEMGRALAEAGIPTLHFDYRGTGDSAGQFEQYNLDDWREDIGAAVDWVRLRWALGRVGLLGLRLGATLAATEAGACRACCLVMWQPVLDGERYARELAQRSKIKHMLTRGPRPTSAQQEKQGDFLDLDGYSVSPSLMAQMGELRLGVMPPFPWPALLVECTPRGEVAAEAQALMAGFPAGEARALPLEPFWQRIGLTDTTPLIATTLQWLQGHGEAQV